MRQRITHRFAVASVAVATLAVSAACTGASLERATQATGDAGGAGNGAKLNSGGSGGGGTVDEQGAPTEAGEGESRRVEPEAPAGMAAEGGAGAEGEGRSGFAPPATDPQENRLSTFAVDIDTASYDYSARLLGEERMPEPEQVRPEEFVNAFDQNYPEPEGDGIAVHTDGSRVPEWYPQSEDSRLVRVGLSTRSEPDGHRDDAFLTFVIDVSGSMEDAGKLDLVKSALHALIDQLRPTDAVAIVAFSEGAEVLQEMTPVTGANELHAAVEKLTPGGGTNLADGLVTGYQVARDGFFADASNRVVLLSDGLANQGETGAESILTQVREQAKNQISLLGVGVGADYGDALMEELTNNGDGYAVYVSDVDQAKRTFVERLPATLAVRARDAKIQVDFDPGTVANYRLIGFENRALEDEEFRNDSVEGGQLGPGHTVTALYRVDLKPGASGRVATATTRWLSPSSGEPSEETSTIVAADLDNAPDTTPPGFQVATVAAAFAEYLRDGGNTVDLTALQKEAERLSTLSEDSDVRRLADLIGTTEQIDWRR